jgi:hypothetical protein
MQSDGTSEMDQDVNSLWPNSTGVKGRSALGSVMTKDNSDAPIFTLRSQPIDRLDKNFISEAQSETRSPDSRLGQSGPRQSGDMIPLTRSKSLSNSRVKPPDTP